MKTHLRILAPVLSAFILSGAGSLNASEQRSGAPIPIASGVFGEARSLQKFSQARALFAPSGGGSRAHAPVAEALDTIFVNTGIFDEEWDQGEEAWMGVMDVDITYDSHGWETDRTVNIYMFNAWVPQLRLTRTYDATGRLTRILSRIWTGGAWQNNARDTIIYNASGLPVEERVETFNGAVWGPYQRYVITYDGSLRPVEVIGMNWSVSTWLNSFRYGMSYDGEGRESEFLTQNWVASAWVNSALETYAYDTNDNLMGQVNQIWSAGAWLYDTRTTWSYDDNRFLVEDILEIWGGSAWENDTRNVYTNGATGMPEEILRQYWGGVDWADDKITYISYDREMAVEDLTMSWTGSTWVNFHKTSYAWQQIVTSGEVTQQVPMSDKWNMVSVPLDVADHAKTAVFPTAVSNAFAFDAGYATAPLLENGRGYWLKFDGVQNVAITGLPVASDTFDVVAGWNMVGSIGVPVAAGSVGSIPGGLVSSNFFAFANGYVIANVIEPGKGYWVKVSQAGKLILSGSGNTPVASRLRMELAGEMPPAPPVDPVTGAAVPARTALGQNYPNPFNPSTTVTYSLAVPGRVRIAVYNTIGQEVATLVDEFQEAGERSVRFDGDRLPSGVYTCRITAGGASDARKILLVR